MPKARVIAEFTTAEEARRVEETVKTGYVDSISESLTGWLAAEEDLGESYGKLAQSEPDAPARAAFQKLREDSLKAAPMISGLLDVMKALDRDRTERIHALAHLKG